MCLTPFQETSNATDSTKGSAWGFVTQCKTFSIWPPMRLMATRLPQHSLQDSKRRPGPQSCRPMQTSVMEGSDEVGRAAEREAQGVYVWVGGCCLENPRHDRSKRYPGKVRFKRNMECTKFRVYIISIICTTRLDSVGTHSFKRTL